MSLTLGSKLVQLPLVIVLVVLFGVFIDESRLSTRAMENNVLAFLFKFRPHLLTATNATRAIRRVEST